MFSSSVKRLYNRLSLPPLHPPPLSARHTNIPYGQKHIAFWRQISFSIWIYFHIKDAQYVTDTVRRQGWLSIILLSRVGTPTWEGSSRTTSIMYVYIMYIFKFSCHDKVDQSINILLQANSDSSPALVQPVDHLIRIRRWQGRSRIQPWKKKLFSNLWNCKKKPSHLLCCQAPAHRCQVVLQLLQCLHLGITSLVNVKELPSTLLECFSPDNKYSRIIINSHNNQFSQ